MTIALYARTKQWPLETVVVHELAHLFEAIVTGGDVAPFGATFEDGYRAAVVCDAIADAARERTHVQITY